MASADLRYELTCSICLNIYRDPVTLPCGHSFCRLCIAGVLNAQEEYGAYTCPECRAESQERPALEKNRKLGNIAQTFQSLFRGHRVSVTAVQSCLLCEASLCQKHLKVLEYYCCEDAACICVSCSLAGEHRGHQVETLNEASEKKKEKVRNILQKLTSQREEAEKSVQNLEELRRQVQEKAAGVTGHVSALIKDIRERLEALEKRVLSEISRQEEQVSLRVSDLIRQLEIKKEELTRKMGDIEDLCDMTDPLTVLQEKESDRDDYYMVLGVNTASDMLLGVNTASDMVLGVNTASDMVLNVNTAGNHVSVSGDLKTLSWTEVNQNRPETPERFQSNQVLSIRCVTSGKHYWVVEGSELGRWSVGMASVTISRKGRQSHIGNNNKSWGLWVRWHNNQYSVKHDRRTVRLPHVISCQRLGIYLDYEAGRLSFYELCDPIKHIHTFTAAFTEPLYFGLGLGYRSLRSNKSVSVVENGWVRIVNCI
uniref:Uncharacterized protein n=1 Tax=Leptobrachium leishanense TaxID=445787 RepID=A0A8C5PXV0_9ANUR